ncbi:hypothetical protein DSL64_08425 [Dyadobacter luteus]|uniref:Uncharacterized protein n=1 Tax=Dyadobacter luteus TaxID=2259619 RepID=A0A3D8YFE1_9BACT|nr:hypothetical protein DSL64_08425 [Dyadobacter luteus]
MINKLTCGLFIKITNNDFTNNFERLNFIYLKNIKEGRLIVNELLIKHQTGYFLVIYFYHNRELNYLYVFFLNYKSLQKTLNIFRFNINVVYVYI